MKSKYNNEIEKIEKVSNKESLKKVLLKIFQNMNVKQFTMFVQNIPRVRNKINKILKRNSKVGLIKNVYDLMYNIKKIQKCRCGKELKYKNFKFGYNTFCENRKCKFYREHVDSLKKKTNLERYGGHPMKTEKVKSNFKNSLLEKYGFDNITKYRVSVGLYKTNMGTKEFKEKRDKTFLEKYGGHPMQCDDVFERNLKSRLKFKEYTLPSNKIIKIQGYENFALDYLLKNYKEDDIVYNVKDIHKLVGKIFYEYENKTKKYYPDFYIKSENKIYEVKSIWTYKCKKKSNILKKKACEKNGLLFEFLIFNDKGERIYEF